MNNTTKNFNTTSARITRPRNLPLSLSVTILVLSTVILISNCFGHLMLLSFTQKKHNRGQRKNSPSNTLIRCISVVSLFASIVGLPSSIVLTAVEFRPLKLCSTFMLIQFQVLIASFALVLHFIACLSAQRMLIITSAKYKMTHGNVNKVVAAVIIYILVTWSAMLYDNFPKGSSSYYESRCLFLNSSDSHLETPLNTNYTIIIIVSLWMHFSNLTILFTTSMSIKFIRKASKSSTMNFGNRVRQMETKRVFATFGLSLCFILFWIPFGVFSGESDLFSIKTHVLLLHGFRVLAHGSFLVLPIIYYAMDKRFEKFVNIYLRRRARKIFYYGNTATS